jgi:hypothetical protein
MGTRHAVAAVAPKSRVGATLLALVLLPPFLVAAYRVIDPWPRAECKSAARHALAHRSPGDPILVNHWEYGYYLRHEASGWRMWNGAFQTEDLTTGTLWVIHTDMRAIDQFPFPLPVGWAVTDRTEFRRTAVFRLQRIDGQPTSLRVSSAED